MNWSKFINRHRLELFVVLFLIVVATLYFAGGIRAQVPGIDRPFYAAEKLDPTCDPINDENCYVAPLHVDDSGTAQDASGANIFDLKDPLGDSSFSAKPGGVLFVGADDCSTNDNPDCDDDSIAELKYDPSGTFFWDENNNRLGIGTTDPEEKLTVETDMGKYGVLHIVGGNEGVGAIKMGTWIGSTATITGGWFGTKTEDPLYLFTNGGDGPTPRLTVNTDGNVGIGTTDPSARLTVGDGTVDGAITTIERTVSDTAGAISVSWNAGNQQKVTLTGNATITFSGYVAGQTLRLIVCNDDVDPSYTVSSWTDETGNAVFWSGNGTTPPPLTQTADHCDVLTFLATGAFGPSTIFGSTVLDFGI